jgi:hypothetical protein
VPAVMTRPGHRRHHDPVHGAGHPRRVGLQLRPHGAQVQCPPAPPPGPAVIDRAPASAGRTASPLPFMRAHMHHDRIAGLIEVDPLHRGLLDPEQPGPYPARTHAVLRSVEPVLDKRGT